MLREYHINGTITFEEYLECHKILASKRRLWIRGGTILYGIAMLIYGILLPPSKPDSTLSIIGAIMLTYGVVISPVQFRFRVKRNWDRYPKIRKGFDITVSPEGLVTLDDKGAPAHSSWDSFMRFRESNSLFLLYLSPLLPICIPKRLVPLADLAGLRNLLSSAIEHHTHSKQSDGGDSANPVANS